MKRKIILDIVMGIIMICLMNLSFTGIKLHEILGIVIFFLFLFHKILNYKWIKSITMNLFKKDINVRTKIMYIVDVILLILVILNVVTGILISTYILTSITTTNIEAASNWHHFFAYWLVIILLIHIGLHWEFIRNAIKIKKDSVMEKTVLVLIVASIIVVLFKSNIIKKLMLTKREIDLPFELENTIDTSNSPSQKVSQEFSQEPLQESTQGSSQEPSQKDDEQDDSSTITEQPTIEEYLSKLFCTACGRHCPLTSPACGRGVSRQSQEVQEYNQMYGTNETYTSSVKFKRDEF